MLIHIKGIILNQCLFSSFNKVYFDINFIASPLNYMGGKYKLLNQILPILLHKNADCKLFIDLFCGGANVGVNIAKILNNTNIILNDKNEALCGILSLFKNNNFNQLCEEIEKIINNFNLSNSALNGYDFYKCNSAKGLSSFNKKGFLELKMQYNKENDMSKRNLLLFILIIFSFNNQIRFNQKGEFNLPCGKRDFNLKMKNKLYNFMEILKQENIEIKSQDFRDFADNNFLKLLQNSKTLFYVDPPYFLAQASYNENNAWSENDENDLLEFLEILNFKKINFAFSNVIFHKGKTHSILHKWINKNQNFNCHYLKFSYKNCNYNKNIKKNQNLESNEVLITNF